MSCWETGCIFQTSQASWETGCIFQTSQASLCQVLLSKYQCWRPWFPVKVIAALDAFYANWHFCVLDVIHGVCLDSAGFCERRNTDSGGGEPWQWPSPCHHHCGQVQQDGLWQLCHCAQVGIAGYFKLKDAGQLYSTLFHFTPSHPLEMYIYTCRCALDFWKMHVLKEIVCTTVDIISKWCNTKLRSLFLQLLKWPFLTN